MDIWQKHVYDKCLAFIGKDFAPHSEHEVLISLGQREAYVVLMALEDQQRYLNPLLVAPQES